MMMVRIMMVRLIARATRHHELRATCFPRGGVPTIQGTCEVCEKSPINFIKNWAMWILLMFSDDVHPLDALQRCYHQVIILHPRRFTIFGSALPILIFEAPFLGIVEKELMGLWDGLFYFFTFFLGFWFTFFLFF